MQENELQKLKQELRSFIATCIDAKFSSLETQIKKVSGKVDSVQKTVDLTESEMSNDRRDIGDLKILQKEAALLLDEIRQAFPKQTEKIAFKIKEHVDKAIDTAAEKMTGSVQPAVKKTLTDFVAKKGDKLEPIEKNSISAKIKEAIGKFLERLKNA